MRGPPRLLTRLALAATGAVVGLAIVECFLRWAAPPGVFYLFARFVGPEVSKHVNQVADPSLGVGLSLTGDRRCYGLRPNFRARMKSSDYDVKFETNALGLRNRPIGEKSGRRVLGLGDSFAMGFGVEASEAFYSLLERNLGAEFKGQVEVVNAGVMGYSPTNSRFYLEDHGWSLSPDAVVLEMWAANSIWYGSGAACPLPPTQKSAKERVREAALHLYAAQFLVDRLRAYDPIRQRLFTLGVLARYGVVELLTPGLAEKAAEPLREFERLLADVNASCQARDVPFLLLVTPLREQVSRAALDRAIRYNVAATNAAELDVDQPTRLIVQAADRVGVPVLNPLAALRERCAAAPCYFENYDPHFNATGHRVMAAELSEEVARMLAGRQPRP